MPRRGHATEQAASWIGHDDCIDNVYHVIATWSQRHEGHAYSGPELLLHKRMWDVMTRNKAGMYKAAQQPITALSFAYWCRRVVSCKTKHGTEHGEGSASFRALAEDIFSNDLTERQMRDPKYKLREGKALTRPQRSLINVILRQHLGDAKVASFLFNHDIPSLLDLPIQRAALTKTLLQNMLEEFVNWHVSLLHSLLERQPPDVIVARRLSNLNQKEWQRQRWRWKLEAKQRLDYGASLLEQRDRRKRKSGDLSATEQQVLEACDTEKTKKIYEVGVVTSPLTEEQTRGTCSCHRILWNFYCRRNQCHRIFYGPGDLTVEVINVHVPSHKKKLTDEQRKILLRSLLQSNSNSMPGQIVGSARFLIGGDINMA